VYIKANGLQDPRDKRYILCDDKLSTFLGNRVHMMTMNKILSSHIFKPDDIVGGHPSSISAATVSTGGRKRAAKSREFVDDDQSVSEEEGESFDETNSEAVGEDEKSAESINLADNRKKKQKVDFGGPFKLPPKLATLVNAESATIKDVVRLVWEYAGMEGIKVGANICCNEYLKDLFGRDSVHFSEIENVVRGLVNQESDFAKVEDDKDAVPIKLEV